MKIRTLSICWIISGSLMIIMSFFYPMDRSILLLGTYVGTFPFFTGMMFVIIGLLNLRSDMKDDKLKKHKDDVQHND